MRQDNPARSQASAINKRFLQRPQPCRGPEPNATTAVPAAQTEH
jgi:hypothetical protein